MAILSNDEERIQRAIIVYFLSLFASALLVKQIIKDFSINSRSDFLASFLREVRNWARDGML